MNREEVIRFLKRRVVAWNRAIGYTIQGSRYIIALLFPADFSEADLSGADFNEAFLFRANLSSANLHRANLRGTTIGADDIIRARLDENDLRNRGARIIPL